MRGVRLFFVACAFGACQSGTEPSPLPDPSCTFSVTAQTEQFASEGGSGTISVTAPAECVWTATSDADWLTITAGQSGSGDGAVTVAASPNTSTQSRTATLTVAGQTVTVTQSGVGCSFAVEPSSVSVPAEGGSTDITVTAPAGCDWTATSDAEWLTITSEAGGSGDGTVSVAAEPNTTALSRTGTATVAGETVTFTQSGVGCSFAVAPPSVSVPAEGGSADVAITAPTGCDWTVTSDTEWLTVTGSASGSGDGTVSATAAPNPTAVSRSGTLTVAGQTVTFMQSGVTCSFTVDPSSVSVAADGGSTGLDVTAPDGCEWTATSGAAWLTITAGTSGSGDGTASVTAAPNTVPQSRSGTVTVAGQTVTFTQEGISCSFAVDPLSAAVPAGGGSSVVVVTATAGCGWTATSNASWLTITGGASGFGGGTVSVTATANTTGEARTGTLTVAGQTITFTQAACSFVVSPESVTVPAVGGAVNISVTTTVGCGWTATSNASWLTITGGVSGFGSGTVSVDAAAHSGSEARSGTVIVAGETVTFTQDPAS